MYGKSVYSTWDYSTVIIYFCWQFRFHFFATALVLNLPVLCTVLWKKEKEAKWAGKHISTGMTTKNTNKTTFLRVSYEQHSFLRGFQQISMVTLASLLPLSNFYPKEAAAKAGRNYCSKNCLSTFLLPNSSSKKRLRN